MSGTISALSEKYLSAAESSAAEGNEVNMKYFLEEAILFAEQAGNCILLTKIESRIFELFDVVYRSNIYFCLDRAEAIIRGDEPDRMSDSPKMRVLSAYNLARDAQKGITAIKDKPEHKCLTERANTIFAELNKKDLPKYISENWKCN